MPVCQYCVIKQDVWILNVNHLVKARTSEVIKVADGKLFRIIKSTVSCEELQKAFTLLERQGDKIANEIQC